jgi:hypothetical protein
VVSHFYDSPFESLGIVSLSQSFCNRAVAVAMLNEDAFDEASFIAGRFITEVDGSLTSI